MHLSAVCNKISWTYSTAVYLLEQQRSQPHPAKVAVHPYGLDVAVGMAVSLAILSQGEQYLRHRSSTIALKNSKPGIGRRGRAAVQRQTVAGSRTSFVRGARKSRRVACWCSVQYSKSILVLQEYNTTPASFF